MQRYAYIDALRGYAILGVITVHASQQFRQLPETLIGLTGQGARGVQLFFVASAFTLMLSWHSRNDQVTPFFIRRFFRIAPMFWLAMTFFLFLDGLAPRHWAPNGIGWPHVITTATFLHGWHPETINSIVPGGWSIAVEMTFYLIFPLLVISLRTWWSAALALIVVIALVGRLNAVVSTWWPDQAPYIVKTFVYFWFPNQLPSFLTGILVFRLTEKFDNAFPKFLLEIGAPLFFGLAILAPVIPIPKLQSPTVAVILFGATLFCLTQNAGRWLLFRSVRFAGSVSYSGYLWHFAVLGLLGVFFRTELLSLGVDGSSRGVLIFFIFYLTLLGLTAALSTLTFRYIEIPGINLGRRLAIRFTNSRHLPLSAEISEVKSASPPPA